MNAGRHSGRLRWQWPEVGEIAVLLLLIPLTLLLLAEAAFSLEWRIVYDTPLLHYVAFLIDRYHYVPYRDVWETSMPGTFLFHLAIGKTLGYGDLAFRVVDVVWLGMLLAVTWGILARFGRQVAWAGIVLFGLAYFQHGPGQSLQRDYIGVLPIAAAVLLQLARRPNPWLRAIGCGLLFGLAATIKPQLALGLPLLLVFQWRENRGETQQRRRLLQWGHFLASLGGCAAPFLACLLWLWLQGAWPAFWEMALSFLPLHLQLTYGARVLAPSDRPMYLLSFYLQFGGHALWLIPAGLGVFPGLFAAGLPSEKKRAVALLLGLTVLYSIYPVVSGQFWPYHWFPFLYFVILLASLSLLRWPARHPSWVRLISIGILAVIAVSTFRFLPEDLHRQFQGLPPLSPKGGRVDEIARFLRENLHPGDLVQPLDWTWGAVHAMLIAEARVATPFIYDYMFYFHTSHPYIQNLRRRFIEQLQQTRPRFIIQVTSPNKPWVSGLDTTQKFRELEDFIAVGYVKVAEGNGYVIYERK